MGTSSVPIPVGENAATSQRSLEDVYELGRSRKSPRVYLDDGQWENMGETQQPSLSEACVPKKKKASACLISLGPHDKPTGQLDSPRLIEKKDHSFKKHPTVGGDLSDCKASYFASILWSSRYLGPS